jgi:hypothetical protein
MGLGKLLLTSSSKKNIITAEETAITCFFKKVANLENNISNETIPQFFKSTPTFGRRVTVNLSKHGDMISNMTLFIELPELPKSKHTVLPSGVKKIAWVKKTALALIKYIDLEIGGKIINRHYNDWLNINYEFNSNTDSFYNMIADNIDIVNTFTNGKKSYKLYLPLQFFFNTNENLAFPILSIQKQDIKIHIEFNSFENCIRENPSHYIQINENICLFKENELIRQNVDGNLAIGKFSYFDVNNKRVYYEKIYNDFIIPSSNNNKYKINGDDTKYIVSLKLSSPLVKDEPYIYNNTPTIKDAYILVNYIYLSNNERWFFLNKKLSYIIPLVNTVLEKNLININNNYKLTLSQPTKLLVWRVMLNSNIDIKDYFNFSSSPILDNNEPLVLTNKLFINSLKICNIDNYEFYSYLQNYMNKFFNSKFIYQYPFGLNVNDSEEKGSLNFSKIDDVYLQVNLNKIVNYQNSFNIKAYSIYYNIYEINHGTSAFKFQF